MKTTGTLFAICLFAFFTFGGQLYAQTAVALIVEDENNLSERENAIEILLQDINYNVALINYGEASYDVLSDYLYMVATNDGAISSDDIYQLIFNGKNVVLLHDAAKSLGGSWRHSTDEFWSSDRVYYRDLPFRLANYWKK